MYRLNRSVAAPGGVRDLRRLVRRWVGELSPKGRARRCLRAGLLAEWVRSRAAEDADGHHVDPQDLGQLLLGEGEALAQRLEALHGGWAAA
jgi:hypothetical protein